MLCSVSHDARSKRPSPRFRSPTPPSYDDGSPIPAEWRLRCPACDYDLTGLSTRRCPECGRIFDPHAIWVEHKRRAAGVGRHVPAYVVYAATLVMILALLPLLRGRLWSLLPLGILPAFELTALFFNFRPAATRPIIAGLLVVACFVIRFW
jgi:hypothetical protein